VEQVLSGMHPGGARDNGQMKFLFLQSADREIIDAVSKFIDDKT